MSEENKETIRRLYAAWNADDFELSRPSFHPEVEWITSGTFPGIEPVYHGREGVHAFWTSLKEAWEYFDIHVIDLISEGGWVVTRVRFEAVGRESGVKVELPFSHAFRVEDGLVTRYGSFAELDDAKRFAGMSVPAG